MDFLDHVNIGLFWDPLLTFTDIQAAALHTEENYKLFYNHLSSQDEIGVIPKQAHVEWCYSCRKNFMQFTTDCVQALT